MNITAIALENLDNNGIGLLDNEIHLTTKENIFPDTYGKCIGRYDKKTRTYTSFFKKDEENGNTYYFDKYRESCNLFEKHRNIVDTLKGSKGRQVIDYYVMYEIKESSKNIPTEIDHYVDNCICMNSSYKCKYELLFACDGNTRRLVVDFKSNNIPMYEFVCDLENEARYALCGEADDSNIFKNVFIDCGEYHKFTMFDEVGMNDDIEIENAEDFMAMLVSVRLLSCEFVFDE